MTHGPIDPKEPIFAGFKFLMPDTGIPHGFYVPPDKAYRIIPPPGWECILGADGIAQFRSHLAHQGYRPGMFIAKEPAEDFQPREAEIEILAARNRQDFRFVSGEWLFRPGTVHLGTV